MKKILFPLGVFVSAALALLGALPLRAQTSLVDTVTITAPDPRASEAGPDPGLFEIRRSGSTNYDLLVFYRVSGTASSGVDYEKLPENVIIPKGSATALLPVRPIDDAVVEGLETVALEIVPSMLLCPSYECGYEIGWPSNAMVIIADNDVVGTNHPPFVQLNAPQDGDVFTAPTGIALRAYAQDTEDGYNLNVEFFEGANSLGFGTFVATRCPPPYCPFYALTWSNAPPGEYTLTAKATDSGGASSVSNPAHITVSQSNRPPRVNIVARDPFASEGTNFWLRGWETNRWAIDLWNAWHVNLGGTNTATFVVRRDGPTNNDLTITYEIGGTASNGVDYVALPGSVVIPAARRSARIVVVPIDDALPEGIETVVLKLKPSTDYAVGFPSHAAAIVVDNDLPRPSCVLLPDHQFHFCEPATNGFCFRLEASSDLRHWVTVCTNVVTDGALHFVDPDAPPLDARFYRAEPEPGLPFDD